MAGYKAAMTEVSDSEPLLIDGDYTRESGARAVATWFDAGVPPTAIIAINDSVAVGVFEALASRRLRVPDDVALAGFDGVLTSELMNMTTVEQDIKEMGRVAVQMLLAQLGGASDSRHPVHKVLPTELLLRSSTPALKPRPTGEEPRSP